MSLLSLLEDAPALDVPEVPTWSLPPRPGPDKPLSPAERVRWDEITQGLGDLSMRLVPEADDVGTPIWDEVSAEYPTLQHNPILGIGALWTDDWIAADFEATWSRAPLVWEQTAPQQIAALDTENAPPPRFRVPVQEHRDRSGLDDNALERVLAGLRRL